MAPQQPEETELPQIVNLSQANLETVQAELVRASQAVIQQLNAEEVDLQTSIVGTIQTGELHARDSIILASASQQTSLQNSIAGGLRAEALNFNGVAALVFANSMANKDVNAIAIIGTDIQADNIQTSILISREVHGNVTTILDGRTALIAGVLGGAVTGLILIAGKLLFGRKK
jgi:hypothetical protein